MILISSQQKLLNQYANKQQGKTDSVEVIVKQTQHYLVTILFYCSLGDCVWTLLQHQGTL